MNGLRSVAATTLAGRIDQCRQRHQGLPAQGPDGAGLLP